MNSCSNQGDQPYQLPTSILDLPESENRTRNSHSFDDYSDFSSAPRRSKARVETIGRSFAWEGESIREARAEFDLQCKEISTNNAEIVAILKGQDDEPFVVDVDSPVASIKRGAYVSFKDPDFGEGSSVDDDLALLAKHNAQLVELINDYSE